MKILSLTIPQIIAFIGKAISLLSIAMVLITFTVVVLRYGFSVGWIALQESIMYLHAMCFMLMSAYTLQTDGHVRVDIFYAKLSAKRKAIVDLAGTVLFLFPVCGFITAMSWDYVLTSWRLLEASQEAGGLPLVFVLKTLIPLFCLTMALQGVAIAIRCWQTIQGHEEGESV